MSLGIPLTTASFYANITMDQLKNILRSDSEFPIPMIEERLEILHQTGKILMEKFGGSYLNCVKASEKSAVKLMHLVVENFPSYRDEGVFQVCLDHTCFIMCTFFMNAELSESTVSCSMTLTCWLLHGRIHSSA